ncbi:Crp/Fnr family transcriptional regulator [Desulfospira joergensenii]|uniref:Crp/Fnr family transcriptional regulator n=1 Tax=Desulfospira joergensenii TaxID=53329 RepID=UPI0003B38257|nr:cyclic nucleotide-binding domain-containing protein [Desulfospira joergensenii]
MVKIEDLKRINMLSKVPDPLLEIISREAQLNIYGADTQLFAVGDKIDTFYLMIMGQVALKMTLSEDIDVILDNLQSGRSFGSSALIEGSVATYTAVCQEPCEVITLKGSRMLELFETNKELAFHVMTGVAGQYKRTMDKRARMILKTLEENPDLKSGVSDISELTPVF